MFDLSNNTNFITTYSPVGKGIIGKNLSIEGDFSQWIISKVQIGDQILKIIYQSKSVVRAELPMFPVSGPLIILNNKMEEWVLEKNFEVEFEEKIISPSRDLLYKFRNHPWS